MTMVMKADSMAKAPAVKKPAPKPKAKPAPVAPGTPKVGHKKPGAK